MGKRILSFVLTVIMFFVCCPLSVFAAEDNLSFSYELTIDGKETKNVETGDIITVVLKLHRTDKDEVYTMHSMQDEIRYDSTFFELVEDSVVISQGITVTDIAMVDHHREFYMNYLSFTDNTIWNPDTLIGSFQLKVIAENGIANITNQDCLVSFKDGSGSYDCSSNSVKVILSEDCTVVFESNGGTEVQSQKVMNGKKVKRPKDPVKEGFAFVGWYRDYDLTDEWDFSKDTVESNMHLYAKWTEGEPSGTLPSKDGKCFCWLWILLLIIIALVLRKYYKDQKRKK